MFRDTGVHIKPHSHMRVTTTLIGERTDGRGRIAQAAVLFDWGTPTEQQFIDWLRACADDYERARADRRAQANDPPVV